MQHCVISLRLATEGITICVTYMKCIWKLNSPPFWVSSECKGSSKRKMEMVMFHNSLFGMIGVHSYLYSLVIYLELHWDLSPLSCATNHFAWNTLQYTTLGSDSVYQHILSWDVYNCTTNSPNQFTRLISQWFLVSCKLYSIHYVSPWVGNSEANKKNSDRKLKWNRFNGWK